MSQGSFTFVNFTMDSVTIPVYTCRPDTNISENDLYILALYGNHYAKSTSRGYNRKKSRNSYFHSGQLLHNHMAG